MRGLKISMSPRLKIIIAIVFGNAAMGFAYALFVLPLNIVGGGTGGIGIILRSLFGMDPTLFITIFLWAMFLLGFLYFGKDFALKTLPSAILYPLSISLFENMEWIHQAAATLTDPLIGSVFAGVLYGAGVGVIFRVGGTTGGVDIPAFILSRYTKIAAEKIIFGFDVIIILGGVFAVGLQSALVGIIMAFLSMTVIDRIMFGGSETMLLYIISEKHEEINQFILHTLKKGSTILNATGGYTKQPRPTIQVVISRSQYYELEKFTQKVDPQSFIIVVNARDVYGEGFKKMGG